MSLAFSKENRLLLSALSASLASLYLVYKLLAPRSPLLSSKERDIHLHHLDRLVEEEEPEGYGEWKPPHRVRLSKKVRAWWS